MEYAEFAVEDLPLSITLWLIDIELEILNKINNDNGIRLVNFRNI